MKPVLYSFPKTQQESFSVQTEEGLAHFYDVLHYHPELQITIILESYGTYFIGDSIERFQAGDIFLIGPNLPHVFRNDQAFYKEDPTLRASFISMYFNDQSFGKEFFKLPEMWHINQLLKKASRGIKAEGRTKEIVGEKMKRLVKLEGFDRFLMLLSILNTIATSTEWHYLSKVSFSAPQKETESKKINDVFDYIMNNFNGSISLEAVASVANMSTTAFSRYFKQRTQKTFSNFLSEVRIGHACKLLIEGDYNITEISYACGYNNISNFNRQFKTITKHTPSEYLKRYKLQN
ncbi:MAG: AraC family transcriptional regulator [Flammeovirgaceae bacterium]